jgi:glycosyltransferase involved in cell wall biosynthesis
VTTPVGCAATVVRDGENGVIVAPRDSDAIAAATIDLLADPERLRRLGAAARRTVRSMSWRTTAERTIGVYRQALSQL